MQGSDNTWDFHKFHAKRPVRCPLEPYSQGLAENVTCLLRSPRECVGVSAYFLANTNPSCSMSPLTGPLHRCAAGQLRISIQSQFTENKTKPILLYIRPSLCPVEVILCPEEDHSNVRVDPPKMSAKVFAGPKAWEYDGSGSARTAAASSRRKTKRVSTRQLCKNEHHRPCL